MQEPLKAMVVPISRFQEKLVEYPVLARYFLGVIGFLYLIPVAFNGLPGYTTRWVGGFGVLLLPWLLRGRCWNGAFQWFFVLFLGLMLYLAALYGVTGSQDYRVFKDIALIGIQLFPGALLIAIVLSSLEEDYDFIMDILFWGMVFYGSTVVVGALWVDAREWFALFTVNHSNIADTSARARGLLNASGAGTSALIALAFFAGWLRFEQAKALREKLMRLIGMAILFSACLVAGRTGLILIAITVVGFGYRYLLNQKSAGIQVVLFGGAAGVFGLLVLNWIGLFNIRRLDDFYYLFSGQWDVGIWKAFSSFVLWPNSWSGVFWGDPSSYELNRIPSDLGYIRLLWAMGVLGSILYYVFILSLFLLAFKGASKDRHRIFISTLCLWLFFIHFKEPFLLDQRFLALAVLTFVVFTMPFGKSSKPDESVER
ncbi:hypothetical protein ABIE59_003684 [Marinobacter sp. MBR-99]|jgi:hypothetical protein|uniref:hypothetical protein n=1 Tax=Marinobacter sp. MBR-99 TaxID=3156461 RepID=UPI0033956BC9